MKKMLVQRYVANQRVDESSAREALADLIEGLLADFSALSTALAEQDFVAIARQAAKIRDLAAKSFVSEIADPAATLEMAALAENPHSCRVHYEALKRNLDQLTKEDR